MTINRTQAVLLLAALVFAVATVVILAEDQLASPLRRPLALLAGGNALLALGLGLPPRVRRG